MQAPHTSSYSGVDATHSQVEHAFATDLQLLRTRRASFASNSLADALGDSTLYTESTRNEPVVQQPSTRTSRARSSVAGSSTHRHSADVTSPHETVFSIGHDYREQWKTERPQPQPVASSSKAPRALATTPRALAARNGRGAGARDLYELNEKLPYPWHKYDDPLNRRVIPAATKYINELHKTIEKNVSDLKERDEKLEWYESALEAARSEQIRQKHEMHRIRDFNLKLRGMLRNFGVDVQDQ
ncbi:hypothetical protein EVG20_g6055 [Dentipellis fragilis]|uniref:Uncharacterized protein n=1 Tax=Dentipellis fragilis TaxID=205917 RepID=A0A4Y9YQW5_9AGAM|nr:hypothetical protein EVG20_g6055 [Dentipellis fragilis]